MTEATSGFLLPDYLREGFEALSPREVLLLAAEKLKAAL